MRRPFAAAMALALAAALLALPAPSEIPLGADPAEAQSAAAPLVSNIDQHTASNWDVATHDVAAAFTTGADPSGYVVSDVEIRFGAADPQGVSVKLAAGLPARTIEVAALTSEATVSPNAVNTFTAPAKTALAPSTTYYLIVEGAAGNPRGTVSDAEDSGGAPGWTVGNDAYYRSAGSVAGWTADRSALSIRVNGTPAGAVSRRDGLTGSSEGAIAQQSNEPEVPAGCGTVTSPTEWFSSVSAAGATGISVTLVNPLPATGEVRVRVCSPTSVDGTMYSSRSGERALSNSPSGGDAFTVTADTFGDVIIVPDTDYWIRVSDMYEAAKNSDWHYVRTAPAVSAADSHVLLNTIRSVHPVAASQLLTDVQAYAFTTGSAAGGYTLTEATVRFAASDAGASTSVKIFNDGDSAPGSTVVATLTGSYSTAAGDYTFSAPAGTKLAASTKYWLVVNDGVSGTRAKPNRHGQVIASTSLPGWQIVSREMAHRAPGATTWASKTSSLIFRLDGFIGDAPAQPQSLVSNIGQVGLSTSNLGTHDVATEFTTGSHRTGYTLHDVDIPFGAGDLSGVSVKLATGLPGATTEVATFTNPATLTADAVNKFTAPPSTVLQPSTTYWIVVEGTSGRQLRSSSGAEDSDSAAGWSIADAALTRAASSTGSWVSNSFGMSIRVNGYNNPVTAPGKPAAPTVTATWPVSVQVSWAAPSDPGPSGTVSDYDLRWFQGNADPADEADWTEEGETGGPPDPGTGTSVEITGLTPNTAYRVQVRAQDGGESPWSDSVSVSTPFAVLNPEVLVSNIGQPSHATDRADLSTHKIVQGFNVASVGTAFLLSTVEVEFADVPSDVRVNFSGAGGDSPITLANPATLVAGVNAFTAPVGIQLGHVRAWEISVEAESGSIVRKSSQLEDADGKAGWTVFAESRALTPAGVISRHPPIGIRVNGRLAPQALGSNFGQPTNSLVQLTSFDQAVAFTTGSHTAGYTPSDVEVSFIDFGDPPAGVSVKLATGLPSATTEVATFANPATLTTGTNKFAAPDDVVLMPDTTYYVVLEAAAGAVSTTGSDSQDSDVTEFTIGDDTFWRVMSSNGAWTAGQVQVPRMRLNGWINPLTKPSRPAAPTVTATSPVSLQVSWNAPRHLGPDDAISDYDLRWFQGDADPADEADWTEEGDAGGPPDPGTATSAEISGLRPNTAYQVQVRAHGGEESDWSPSGSATTQMELAGARVLATNIDATDSTTVTANLDDHDFAQDFWTPGYAGGYVLKDIEVRFHTAPSDPNSIQVLLRKRGDSGLGPVVAELKNPASIVVEDNRLGGNTFTAPAGTVLDPNSRYLVIVRGKGSGAKLKVKAAPGGACGPAQAWCVGGTRFHFANGRTDADLIPMLLQPHGPLGIRVSGTEHDQALVSNLGQTGPGSSLFLVSVDGAMGFSTGPNAGGYALSDIEMQFGVDTPTAVSVKLARGLPASTIEVATLTNPATVTANAVNTFTAPSGTVLLPNTRYYVVVAGSIGRLTTVNTDGEDAGTASGWALDDLLFHRGSATDPWVPSSGHEELKVRVNGHAVAGVTGVQISSDPGAGDVYGVGEGVDVRLTFSDTVLVSGTPRLMVRLASDGSQDKWAYYHSGSGTSALVFRYLPTGPEAGEDPDDGDNSDAIAVVENSLERDGGTIRQLDGGPVSLAHTGLAANPEHKVDTAPPQLVEVVLNVDPSPQVPTVGAGRLTLIYNEALNESSVPHIDTAANQFNGRRGGANIQEANISVVGNRVEFGIFGNSDVPPNETHTLSYSYDSTNAIHMPIQDLAGNNAATFAGQANAVTARFVSNPSFTDGEAATLSISENNADAASVGTVAATDLDGDTLTYSLAASDDASSFTIDSGTGEVKVASGVTLDHEAKDSYTVTAQVTDGDDPWGGAPRAVKMVSNTGQSHGRAARVGVFDADEHTRLVLQSAQPFTTGTHATGYTLTEVGLYVASWDANLANLTVEIWSTLPHGAPDSLLYTLTNPAAVTVGAVNTFTAPAGAMLAPETAYALVMRLSEGQIGFSMTPRDVEDSGAASGWSIADDGYSRNTNSVNQVWNPGLDAIRISVTASGRPLPDDTITIAVNVDNVNEPPAAAPTGVTVTGRSSRTLSLSWNAVAAAAGGPDPDGYDVRWFAGTADPGDAGDWVEPGEPGGHSTDGTDVTTVLGGLEPNTAYRVQMRAKSPDGPGPWSASVDGMTNNLPTVTIAGGSAVTEGTAAEFTVMIDEAPTADLTVNLEVSEAAGSDLVAAADEGSKTVIIASGATSATYLVTTQADTTNEPHGAVTVEVVAGTGYGPGSNASASVTVNDDDAPTLPGRVLVSNAGQGGELVSPLRISRAQPFTTGSNAEGYTLSGVQFELSDTDPIPEGLTIRIMESTSTNSPGAALGTLTLDQRGTTVTGSTTGIDLQPNTTYFVAMNGGTDGTNRYLRVDSDNEDPGAAPGWTLGDTTRWSNGDSFGNSSSSEWMLSIHGSEFAKPEIQLSFTPAAIAENAMGDVAVTQLTATLLGGSTRAVDTTVRFASALGGTAAAGASNDYELTGSLPQSVTIPAGMTNASVTTSFTIDPVDNGDSDGNRTITLAGEACQDTLMGGESCATTPSDRRFTVNPAVIILEDDDAIPVELSLSTASVDEGGSVFVTLRAERAVASNADAVTVTLAVQEPAADCLDCAVSGTDYTALTLGTLTIRANEASGDKTFTIRATPDVTHEGDERIVIGGSATGTTQFAVVPVTFTINDDDDESTSIALRLTPTSGSEATASHSVRVTATVDNGAAEENVMVALALSGTASGGTASDDDRDYTTPVLPTITILAGQREAFGIVTIAPHNDDLHEPAETIIFGSNGNSTGGLTVPVTPATFSLTSDDTEPTTIQLSFTPSTVREDAPGDAMGDVTVTQVTATLVGPSTRAVDTTVDLASALGGTAMAGAGNDYELTGSLPGSVTIPAGMSSGSVTASFKIDPVDDDVFDDDRTIELAGEACKVALTPGGNCPTSPTDQRLTVRPAVLTLVEDDLPKITLSTSRINGSDESLIEGQSATFTVKALRGQGGGTARLSVPLQALTLATGGATSGTDYVTNPASLPAIVIPANSDEGNATLTIDTSGARSDRLVEGNEKIRLGAIVAGFEVVPADITIQDNDSASTSIALRLTGITETTESNRNVTVTVEAEVDDGAPTADVTIDLELEGSATGGLDTDASRDYTTPTLENITIAAGQVSATRDIVFPIVQDTLHEGAETIIIKDVNDTSAGGLTVGVAPVTFTINDDDPEPTAIQLSFSPTSIDEDAASTPVTVTATLVGPSTRTSATVVNLATVLGGTAAGGASTLPTRDYTTPPSLPTTVTIPMGMSSASAATTFAIAPHDNSDSEPDKTITLGGSACKIDPGSNPCPTTPTDQQFTVNAASLTLADDEDPVITLSTKRSPLPVPDNDPTVHNSVDEGSSATFTVTASRVLSVNRDAVTVQLKELVGSAMSGDDYAALGALGSITIPADVASATATVTISTLQDRLDDDSETIVLGATLANFNVTPTTITINDDDAPSSQVRFFLDKADIDEGGGGVTVNAAVSLDDAAPSSDVDITLSLSGTAKKGTSADPGRDYTDPGTITITIPEGMTTGTRAFTITPLDDLVDEDGETIIVTAALPANPASLGLAADATLNPTSNTITINDNDTAPTTISLSASPNPILEETTGDITVTITATLAGTDEGSVTRSVDTVVDLDSALGGTATGGGTDYAFKSGSSVPDTVTIEAETSSGEVTFVITSNNDAISEGPETITLGGSACQTTPAMGEDCPDADVFTVNPLSTTLRDDDAPEITLSAARQGEIPEGQSATSVGEDEAGTPVTFTITATRNTADTSDAVTLQLGVKPNPLFCRTCAQSGIDYVALTSLPSITIPANQPSATEDVVVITVQDRIVEGRVAGSMEHFENITLDATVSGTTTRFTVNEADIAITDDDDHSDTVTLSVDRTSVDENGEGQSVTVTATVNDGLPEQHVSLLLDLRGTATKATDTDPGDYSVPDRIAIVIRAFTLSGDTQITIAPNNDVIDDDGETIIFGAAGDLSVTPPNENGHKMPVVAAPAITITDDDTASTVISLSVDPARIAEDVEDPSTGNQTQAGATPVTITATLAGSAVRGSATTVTLDSTLRGTATGAGGDYTSAGLPASVTIPAESSSGSVTGWMITPTLDTDAEGNETILLSGSLSGFTVQDAALVLADNDQPEITLTTERVRPRPGDDDADSVHRSLTEGDEVTFRVTATRDVEANDEAATVVLAIVGGSARAGVDYAAPRLTTIRIPRGRASATVQVTISSIANRQTDGDRGISLGGSAEGFEVIPAAITIADDDVTSTSITLSVGRDTLAEGAGTVAMTVIATVDGGAPSSDVSVAVTLGGTGAGSATNGTDYSDPGTITVTIGAGQISGTSPFRLSVTDDGIEEGDETVTVSGTAVGFIVSSAELTITDNDAATGVVLTASPATINENAGAQVSVTLTATLSGVANRTADTLVIFDGRRRGTANDDDYSAGVAGGSDTMVTIPAGSSSATLEYSYVPINDGTAEGDETILQGGTACKVVPEEGQNCGSGERLTVTAATITLVDDDVPQVTLAVTGGAAEGTASSEITVTATRSAGLELSERLSVPLAVVGGTAASGVDYAAPRLGTVTIAVGETSGTATVTISATGRHDDRLIEGDETILIGVQTGARVRAAAPASVTLDDDDAVSTAIELSLNRTQVAETAGPVLFTATATVDNGAPTADVTVPLTLGGTGAGTAKSGVDYVGPGTITLIIKAGSVSGTKSFPINVLDDRVDEGDETITVSGGTSTGGLSVTVGPDIDITVTDDDVGRSSDVINLAISPNSMSESGGDTTLTVIATLSGTIARGTPTTVTLGTALGGTATGGGTDYALKTGSTLPTTVTIPAGSLSGSSASFVLTPNNDTASEGDETITIDGSLADFTVNPAAAVLVDDDAPVIRLSTSRSVTEGTSASVRVTATRSLAPGDDSNPQVRVPLSVLGGSASSGTDYAALRRLPTVVIAAGKSSGTATVPVSTTGAADDRVREPDEQIEIGVDPAADDTSGFTVERTAITIVDDDDVSQQIALRLRRVGSLVTITASVDGAAPVETVIVTLTLTGAGSGAVAEPPLPITIAAGEISGSTAFVIDPSGPYAGKRVTVTGVATGGLTVPVSSVQFTVSGGGSSSSGTFFGGGGSPGGSGGGSGAPDDDADEPDESDEPDEPPVPDVALTRALRDQAQALATDVDEVLVVNAWSPADIAVAAALAASKPGARVIYVSPRGLARGLSTLLGDLDPAKVTLVGGSKALGADVRRGAQAATEDADVDRLAGRTRIDTAAEAARLVLGDPSVPAQRTLIIANGWSPADTGAAAALAARIPNSAVLYTTRDALPGATESVIDDYQPANIVIVGGSRAASEEVLDAAADAAPDAEVERFAGATRVDTAAEAARQAFDAAPAGAKRTVIVANGWSPADIGAATALAARIPGAVVLYTERGALPDATESVIEEYSPANVVIIGGPAAVPARVVGGILAAAQSTAEDRTAVHRISGSDRLDTAVRAALFTLPDS